MYGLFLLLVLSSLSGCLHDKAAEPVIETCTADSDEEVDECNVEVEEIVVPVDSSFNGSCLIGDNHTRGTWECEKINSISLQARELAGEWEQWNIWSNLDQDWNGTPVNTSNGSDSKWILLEFISTDCSHCWNAGTYMDAKYEQYNDSLQFITIAVDFPSSAKFTSSPEEIAAFQDKTNHSGCMQNSTNCSERPGNPHDWIYADNREMDVLKEFHGSGTPTFIIIAPNGVVAWNQAQNDDENISEALERFFPEEVGGT